MLQIYVLLVRVKLIINNIRHTRQLKSTAYFPRLYTFVDTSI